MLIIEAVVRSVNLQEIKNKLSHLGIHHFETYDLDTMGLSEKNNSAKLGALKSHIFIPRTKIEIMSKTSDAEKIIDVISDVLKTDQTGGEIITVNSLPATIKIKNGKLKKAI